jgi:hypothetical protein
MYSKDWGYFYIIGADGTKYRVIVKEQPYTTAITDKYEQLALSFRSPKPGTQSSCICTS